MKRLTITLFLMTPFSAGAHPGHVSAEQFHGALHGEHLIIILAIIAGIVATSGIIRKFFK